MATCGKDSWSITNICELAHSLGHFRGHGGRVVTLSPPTSEVRFGSRPYLKYESWYLLAVGWQFTVQNLDQLYVLVSSALPTTRHEMTCTVLKAM